MSTTIQNKPWNTIRLAKCEHRLYVIELELFLPFYWTGGDLVLKSVGSIREVKNENDAGEVI